MRAGNVEHPVFILDVEMVMIVGIGVEIGARALDGHLAQQAGFGELVQRVVDGGERHRHLGGQRLGVQVLGGEMAMAVREQDLGERHALAGGPEAGVPETGPHWNLADHGRDRRRLGAGTAYHVRRSDRRAERERAVHGLVILGGRGEPDGFFDCDILAKWVQTARTRQKGRRRLCGKAFEDGLPVLDIDPSREHRPDGRRLALP
ncbi:hypothetical protein KL86PLE_60058 [uncultured Pleomorphomonas sp.]|uniref:Uncharacterized protein n=1 Tax=uncultured Pleomorphomonas sp. TaxID=442121 RepID=A0A212LJN9_9HYPH|nr:hypothetical protein KL86PLE_60058 [uncultured Pleomorphomonas sp.]